MNLTTTIPPTIQIRRGRLFGVVTAVALLAASSRGRCPRSQ